MAEHLLDYTMTDQLHHGQKVSNMAYMIAKKMGLPEDECYDLAVAGLLHDIGKTVLKDEIGHENPMIVEEMKYIRQHPTKGYEILKRHHFDDYICESVLYHHENWDGSGYPFNLREYDIPVGACILRVCDVFCALTDDRPYRAAFAPDSAIRMMIQEIKNYNVEVFLALQYVLHDNPERTVKLPETCIDVRGELLKL